MQKKLEIKTYIQNILLGSFIFMFCLANFVDYKAQISVVEEDIKREELGNLVAKISDVENTLTRYITSVFASFGELYYDEDIKRASLMYNTRLFSAYQQPAHNALRKFILFKDIKNAMVFDSSFNIVTSINRNIALTDNLRRKIINRLENYNNKQLVLEEIQGKKVAVFLLRMNYSESQHAYLVVIDSLQRITNILGDYETAKSDVFLITKTLELSNSLIKLKGANSYNHYNLQENTLLKFNKSFTRSYNAEGEETLAKTKDLDGFDYSFVLGMLKPNYIEKNIISKKNQIKQNYKPLFIKCLIVIVLFLALVYFKLNLQQLFTKLHGKTKQLIIKIKPKVEHHVETKVLNKEAKKEAYSYIAEDGLKSSVYNIYNSIKKMSPEDIRNLSIKNSLSKENIRLMYQPVIDSKTMEPQFCEVFLRLLNYYGEELMPSEFIPVLEHFNMLENLDEMMLEKVIKKIQNLQSSDSTAKISLNISEGAFNSQKFMFKLKESLIKGNINTSNVMLEIPNLESIKNEDNATFIKDLSSYGVNFVVSANTLDSDTVKLLNNNSINFVRLDMSAFGDVLENKIKQDMLKQIIANAKKYKLNLIAERIETEFMFKLAKSLDFNYLQGYYISKPKKYYTHKS